MFYINQFGDVPKLFEIDISIGTHFKKKKKKKKGHFSRGLDFSLVGPIFIITNLYVSSMLQRVTFMTLNP